MDYTILEDIEYPVSISSVELKSKGDWSRTIVKFKSLTTNEFACSMMYPSSLYNDFKKVMDSNKIHTFRQVTIQSVRKYYKKITWDDVERCKSLRNNLNEVFKYKDKPIVLDKLTLLVDINGSSRPTIDEVIAKEYIDVDSPEAAKYLSYNNYESYKTKKRQEMFELEIQKSQIACEEQERLISDLCSGEESYDDPRDWSEEEQVMNALENGNGEYFGY